MIIYIEGNIGSGKSTFINILKEYINQNNIDADVLLEPVEEWENTKDSQGKNILQHYYEDQVKYGFAFQINALISRIKKIDDFIKQSKKRIHFIERSIFTDKNVFLESNFKNGNITEIEYVIYNQWFDYMLKNFNMNPKGFVMLDTPAKICSERIKIRNRTGEESIPLEYLEMIECYHQQWLQKEEKYFCNRVLYIDSSKNFYTDQISLNLELTKIFSFVKDIEKQMINFV